MKAVYEALQAKCAELKLQNVTDTIKNLKVQGLIASLGSFSDIKSLSGEIKNPEKADHLGELLAGRVLYTAGQKIGGKVKGRLDPLNKITIIVDPKVTSMRGALEIAMQDLSSHEAAILSSSAKASTALKDAPAAGGSENRMGPAAMIALVPPVIEAAKSIGGLFKDETTLSALPVKGDSNLLIAGFRDCVETTAILHVPGFGTMGSAFAKKFSTIQRASDTARLLVGKLEAESERIKGKAGKKRNEELKVAEEGLEGALKAFELYASRLHEPLKPDVTETLFEKLAITSETFGDSQSAYLVLYASQLGASGGTRKRTFGSDQLAYLASSNVLFLILSKDGNLIYSGAVDGTVALKTTISAAADDMRAATGTSVCPTK
ncbi:hypothetical protein D0B54_03840 [Solimonas sp. K1W22B-7]|nr:hypothetical protein D0B54_03840 [Solimonas sp. K1W22B-7]